MANKHPNPRRLPATQADVNKARNEGQHEGYILLMTLFLWAWCADFGASDDDLQRMGERIKFYSEEIVAGRLRLKDIQEAMLDEHGWNIEIT